MISIILFLLSFLTTAIFSDISLPNTADVANLCDVGLDSRKLGEKEFERPCNGEVPTLGAEKLRIADEIIEVLGLGDDGRYHDERSMEGPVEGDDVPSFLDDLYDKVNDPESNAVRKRCTLPGLNGNIAKVLHNGGEIIHRDQNDTIIELAFSMKYALKEYEELSQAQLLLDLPLLRTADAGTWNLLTKMGVSAFPRYNYEIHFADEVTIQDLKNEISISRYQNSWTQSHLKVTKSFSPALTNTAKTGFFDVTKPLITWYRKLFSEQHTIFRAITKITENIVADFAKQCIQPILSSIKLLLVSRDRRYCPGAGESSSSKKNIPARNGGTSQAEGSSRDVLAPVKCKQDGKTDAQQPRVPSDKAGMCTRHQARVDFNFARYGYFIIKPRRFTAYFCDGECPLHPKRPFQLFSYYALLTYMEGVTRRFSKDRLCVPTSFYPMTIKYHSMGGGAGVHLFEDLLVHECSCR